MADLPRLSSTTTVTETYDRSPDGRSLEMRYAMNEDFRTALIEVEKQKTESERARTECAVRTSEEKTKQSIEETTRFRYRAISYPTVLAFGIWAMNTNTNGSSKYIAAATIGVLGTLEGVQLLNNWITRSKKK